MELYAKMADGLTKTDLFTMLKWTVLCDTVFSGKAGWLHACYILFEPLEMGVHRGGEILEE